MDFNLSPAQQSCRSRASALARDLGQDAPAGGAVSAAARAGLLDPGLDLLAVVAAVEAMALESAGAAVAFALHTSVLRSAAGAASGDGVRGLVEELITGTSVGAVALSADEVPFREQDQVSGRACWVTPLTDRGVAMVGVWTPETARGQRTQPAWGMEDAARDRIACLVRLDSPGARTEPIDAAGLRSLVCGHVVFASAPSVALGATLPIMSMVRILLAAVGLGMGRRALRESMDAARAFGRTGAGGEQTVQGLLADAATELDAAMLLTWKAALSPTLSLAEASMAKLAVTEATQRAVTRATQVIGGASFRHGHVIERLAQDVRAVELFAGRTEALREAVAQETLPRGD